MRRSASSFLFSIISLLMCAPGYASHAQDNVGEKEFVQIITEEVGTSYPQLEQSKFKIGGITSDSTYLETRFTLTSFFFSRRLKYSIRFNPELMLRDVPAEGLRGIVAHELAHADYFHSHNRLALLGLVRLVFPSSRARFERGADLEAIDLGYGPGLKLFRLWLYQNVPTKRLREKKRDYFSPDEIDAIERARAQQPGIASALKKCVPLNLGAVERELANTGRPCSAANR